MTPSPKPAIVLQPDVAAPQVYRVTRRFNLPAVFVMTTLLAIVCGILKANEARAEFYLFLAIMTAVTCAAQMYAPQAPRIASSVGGAITLVIFAVVTAFVLPRRRRGGPDFLEMLFMSVPLGALAGYLVGTLAASVFLITDRFFGRKPPTP